MARTCGERRRRRSEHLHAATRWSVARTEAPRRVRQRGRCRQRRAWSGSLPREVAEAAAPTPSTHPPQGKGWAPLWACPLGAGERRRAAARSSRRRERPRAVARGRRPTARMQVRHERRPHTAPQPSRAPCRARASSASGGTPDRPVCPKSWSLPRMVPLRALLLPWPRSRMRKLVRRLGRRMGLLRAAQ